MMGAPRRSPRRVARGDPIERLTNAVPTITDNAICIRTWDFSETSQTVCLFGREHGVLRGLAKGSKREGGRFCGGFDLLTRGQVVAIVKPGRDLSQIIEWDLQQIYWPLRRRLDAHRAGLYMADLVYHLITDHDPHPDLFDILATGLESLDDPAATGLSLVRFQLGLLNTTGYKPELHRDAETGNPLAPVATGDSTLHGGQAWRDDETLAFSPRSGGVVADTGGEGRWRVRRETIDLLRRLEAESATGSPECSPLLQPGADVVERASRLLAAYIRHLLDRELPTMSMVFPDLHA